MYSSTELCPNTDSQYVVLCLTGIEVKLVVSQLGGSRLKAGIL